MTSTTIITAYALAEVAERRTAENAWGGLDYAIQKPGADKWDAAVIRLADDDSDTMLHALTSNGICLYSIRFGNTTPATVIATAIQSAIQTALNTTTTEVTR